MNTKLSNMEAILIVGPSPPPYHGVSIMTETIIGSTLSEKFQIVFLDTSDNRTINNMGQFDIKNVSLAVWHGLKCIWFLLSKRPAIVYVPIAQNKWGFLRDCLFVIPAKLLGRHVIVHLHGSNFKEFIAGESYCIRLFIKQVLKKVDRAIVLGENLKSVFLGIIDSEKIKVVSNGLDIEYFDKNEVSSSHIQKELRVLFLGTMSKSKGFLQVLYSMPFILQRRDDVKFIFAGQQPHAELMDTAYEFISINHLDQHVTITGLVYGDTKFELLLSSDIFVFPSEQEGQPIVILEAMAAGLPIITTDTGAISETVIDGENGYIVEKNNPRQIAEKLLTLINNDHLRQQMGFNSRKRYLQEYTAEHFSKHMTDVFKEVLHS